jgi:hypothetical protein
MIRGMPLSWLSRSLVPALVLALAAMAAGCDAEEPETDVDEDSTEEVVGEASSSLGLFESPATSSPDTRGAPPPPSHGDTTESETKGSKGDLPEQVEGPDPIPWHRTSATPSDC